MFEGIPIPSRVRAVRTRYCPVPTGPSQVTGRRIGAFLTAHLGWSWREKVSVQNRRVWDPQDRRARWRPPRSRRFLSRSAFAFCQNRSSCTAATSEPFDHFISSNERRLSQRHTERTAFTLGAYPLTSFAFQILHKMIASCRKGMVGEDDHGISSQEVGQVSRQRFPSHFWSSTGRYG